MGKKNSATGKVASHRVIFQPIHRNLTDEKSHTLKAKPLKVDLAASFAERGREGTSAHVSGISSTERAPKHRRH